MSKVSNNQVIIKNIESKALIKILFNINGQAK